MADTNNDKRIVQLPVLQTSSPSDRPDEPSIEKLISSTASSALWFIPLDYDKLYSTDNIDYGTVRVPMSRIAMLNANGKVPSNMLPSYVDDIIFGEMNDAGTIFTDNTTDPSNPVEYAAPAQSGYPSPSENIIYCDTETNVQYKYVSSTDVFAVIPHSLPLIPGYGINVETTATSSTISVKKPDYVIGTTSNTGVDVSRQIFDIGSLDKSDNLTVTSSANSGIYVEGLTPGSLYRITIELLYEVDGLVPYVCPIDVTVVCNSTEYTSHGLVDLSVDYKQPIKYEFLVSTGTEANECVIRIDPDDELSSFISTTVTAYRGAFYLNEVI